VLVYLLEENAGFGVPAPPEVVGKVCQSVYPIGYRGSPWPVYQLVLHICLYRYLFQKRYSFSLEVRVSVLKIWILGQGGIKKGILNDYV